MTTKFTIPRGTSDILPEDSYKWEYVEAVFRKIAKSYGYKEIITPIFEHTEVFERSAGDTTDIVQKEMYRFQDKKGRSFALRPEGTAPVIRSYIENNLGSDGQITKLFYVGAMFRYDRPQAGRSRQFSQFGCECIGSNHPYYDAENIAVFWTFLTNLGLKNFEVEINSVGCPECSEIYNNALREYFQNHTANLCPDCLNRLDKNPKRLLDCKVPKCKEIAVDAPTICSPHELASGGQQNSPPHEAYGVGGGGGGIIPNSELRTPNSNLCTNCHTHFTDVQYYLKILNIPFIVNPRIVRGLDYYTQTAFEFINKNLGSQNALGGGGRYNGLIQQMGGKDTPAVGFAGGFSRLLISLEQENLYIGENPRPKYYIIQIANHLSLAHGEKSQIQTPNSELRTPNSELHYPLSIISYLRSKGIYAESEIEKTSMKTQMKSADRLKADFVIIIGEDEIAKNVFTLKDMKTGEQKQIPYEQITNLK